MPPSLLHRMVLWEMVKVFTISLLAITGIMLMGGVVAEASQHGLGLAQLAVIIPLMIPSTLPWTIPATTLFAACLVYGRLAADNEVLAIKAAGISLFKVIWPGVLLGLVISVSTMGLYYRIIPYTHHLIRSLPLKNVQELLYAMLKKERGIAHPRLEFELFVKNVQGNKLHEVIIRRRDKSGRFDMVIKAQEAVLDIDLRNRKLIVRMWHGQGKHENGGDFEFRDERKVEFDLSKIDLFQRQARPREMSWKQLHEYRAEMGRAVDTTVGHIRETEEGRVPARDPADLPPHIAALKNKKRYFESEIRNVDTEFQMRPALALGCLCFVLVGGPVGIWLGRGDYLSAFMTCFLPIVFIYYPLMFCGTNLAKEGRLPPSVAVWAADALMAVVGLALYARLLRR